MDIPSPMSLTTHRLWQEAGSHLEPARPGLEQRGPAAPSTCQKQISLIHSGFLEVA